MIILNFYFVDLMLTRELNVNSANSVDKPTQLQFADE